MAIFRQVWTLMVKNWRCNVLRHPVVTVFMAALVPLFFGAFLSFARNLFVPPAEFGISEINDIRPLSSALDYGRGKGRDRVVLVNSGFTDGDIDTVLDRLGTAIEDASPGMEIIRIQNEREISRHCRSSLRGVTTCFNAVVIRSSPDEGAGGFWNYTIRTDAEFASSSIRFDVTSTHNPAQIYMLPVQRAVDTIIARLDDSDADPMAGTREYPYTDLTQDEREDWIREIYQQALISFMGVTFIATIIWVTYHMTGFIATERESGMSTLVDAMMPVRFQWMSQAARIIAHHLSFSIVYAPAWIVSSLIIRAGVFANTSAVIMLFLNLIGGLALTSFSILFASFFKRAQLSGITAILATLLLGILAQSISSPGTGVVVALSVLFTPCSYVYFITLVARFEKQRRGANLLDIPPNSPWEIPGIVLWVFMVIQIFAYPLIGFFIERRLYGTSTKGRVVQHSGQGATSEYAVRLDGFTKIYKPAFFSRLFSTKLNPATDVVAVNELNLNARKGQIVALLGANGSGKSTTLDAIAGLSKLTSGSITIDGAGGLGIAPQKNVLWDDLTVEEHLHIFNRLKSPGATASVQEIRQLIDAVDLTKKRRAKAKTLSGGQKRKLQLGMMLTGGSAVCCVDEVSSGIDPLSRRKLWDILLAERGRRTMILTTHFLDEADLLADHIAILSKGTLRAEGSSVELKDRLGGGYKVHVQKTPDLKHTPEVEGVQKKHSLDLITYNSPSSGLSARVIKELEAAGINDYRYSGPTIEDVFLQVAEEIREEEAFRSSQAAEHHEKGWDEDSGKDAGIKLMDGKRVGYVKQATILLMKRVTVLKRNWLPYVLAFLLPIIAAGLTSLFIQGQDPPGCNPGDQASASRTQDAFSQADDEDIFTFLAGPPDKVSEVLLSRLMSPVFGGSGGGGGSNSSGGSGLGIMRSVDTFADFQDTIERDRKNLTMGLWLGDDGAAPTFAWVANLFVTSPITAQQFLNMVLTNTTIQTTWSPFDRPFNPQTGDSLNLVIYMGLALSCYPAFFSLYPSNERRNFVRNLQYSNGVRPFPLWVAYILFDFSFVLVASAILTAIWAGASSIWYHLEYVFVVLFLYGLAAILMAYFVSLFTKSQLGTYAWSAAIQAVCFLAYLIAYMCVNTYVPVAQIDTSLLIVHFVISAIAPIGSAIRAIFLAVNLFSVACDGDTVSDDPGGILQYGGPILYLIIQCLLLFGLVLWFDAGSASTTMRGLFSRHKEAAVDQDHSDEDIDNEMKRVTSQGIDENGLRVAHLTKSFKKNTAVDNVSFGIRRGEVFALLGPNGAGKSTTISLIRGDIKPSRNGGDVLVEDVSVIKNLAAARANLGVCPQFDALDQMTVREHLEFYAKVRGIPDVEHNVVSVLQAVGLSAFSGRMAHALSGGNKRKLSLGIALMGNPTVVLLDEPSSGLDAASKRVMWKTLAAAVPGRSILLTTHSMEEADALAGRVGIMARRMLALGTPDNLRHRFGDALHIHLVSASAPRTTAEEMDRVVGWIRSTFPAADVEEKTYHGQLRFSVHASEVLAITRGRVEAEITRQSHDVSQSAIGNLMILLEENKAQLGIGHYSVCPTTLDQVFLAIVGQHNVKEEGYEESDKVPLWKRMLCMKY